MATTTSYQTTIPEYARPSVETLLGKAEALTSKPYDAYGYERISGFDPMQLQAQQMAANMGPAQQIGLATQMAGLAGLNAGNAGNYNAGSYGNYYQSPQAYQSGQFSSQNVNAPNNLQYFQAGGPQQVGSQAFIQPGTADAYMSPYMQAVTDIAKREANRNSAIQQQDINAQAAKAGAFGGSRHGFVEAERMRNLNTQLNDLQATGSQAAYQNAQQQFNADQGRFLQAGMANQQAGLQTNLANLNAALGVQQLGSGYNMQSQLANQQANMQAQQLGEQSRQFGFGQQMNAAQLAAQYGLAGDQLTEQSRQFGANLGMQGVQQQLAAAGQLGNLGQLEFNQQKDIINATNTAGAQRQALQQQLLDTQYQDFLRQQQYPYQQLGFMSDVLRGLPLTQYTSTQYQNPPSMASQAAGTLATGYALYNKAEGGEIKDPHKNSAGLADLLLHSMR